MCLVRVEPAINRYIIRDQTRISNYYEIRISFKQMASRSICRGIGKRDCKLYITVANIKDKLDLVTFLAVVSANGCAYKLIILFS